MKTRFGWALASAVLLGSIGSAYAADMPLKAPPPVVAPIWSWSGFYIGGNVGGAWTDNRRDYNMPFTAPGNVFAVCGVPAGAVAPVLTGLNPFDLSTDCSSQSSVIGGGQIGYNWQQGGWLFGVEADGAWQHMIEHSFVRFGNNPFAGSPMGTVANDTAYFRSEHNALGTFRGRLGFAGGSWLIYATGGLAVGNVTHSVTEVLSPGVTCPVAPSVTCRTGSDDVTKWGWTVGAGVEWMFARNWSIGAEYLYVDLGRSTLTLAALPAATSPFFFNASSVDFHDREHVARLKVNYHFGGPVVAKY